MAGQDETTQQGVAETVQARPTFFRVGVNRKFLLFFVAPAIVACVLYVCMIGPWLTKRGDEAAVVQSLSPQRYSANQVKLIQQNPPASSAPVKAKLTYYDNLYDAQILAEDYKSATQTFATRTRLSTDGLSYRDYFQLADVYYKAGDKPNALVALDKAEQLLPPDDPESGYVKAETLEKIQAFRQRLQQP